MKYTDFYTLLNVSADASSQDIRRAYRQQAKRYHPDTHPGDREAEQQFKAVKEAYEVLSDPEKRARFDQLSRNWGQYKDFNDVVDDLKHDTPPPPPEEPVKRPRQDAESMFNAHFGGFYDTFFGPETAQFWERRGQSAPELDMDSASHASEQEPASESDSGFTIEYKTEVSLEEALKGTHRRVQIHEGTFKTIDVTIPAGVVEGSKVHVPREGEDFYLIVHLLPHAVFRPDGHDLHRDLHICDYEALLGTKKTLSTLSGALQMNIPAGSDTGKTFRIRGHGLAHLEDPAIRGDLFVHLKVDISQDLSAEEKRLIEMFRDLRVSRQTSA